MRRAVLSAAVCSFLFSGVYAAPQTAPPPAQAPSGAARVDFVRDVRPILEQHCYECHGPDKQMNGFRLDRRRDAMRGGTMHVISTGSALSSKLFLRLVGTTFGRRMPVDADPLAPEQIETIGSWIDQGAEWPDAAAGDPVLLPLDPSAVAAFAALRSGDRRTFLRKLQGDPRLSTLRGPGGATPLMTAVLYGDAALVRTLLARGAKPNVANDAGVTPLMWAVTDLEKTRALVDAGAAVDARSDDGRSPILIAAGIRGNRDVVALLLDRGARPLTTGSAGVTALTEAAKRGDEPTVRLLLERGPELLRTAAAALALAVRVRCDGCAAAIGDGLPAAALTQALTMSIGAQGSGGTAPALLDRGANATARNPLGFPALVLAAASDREAEAAVAALLAHGADVNAAGPNGETALDFARRNGRASVVEALLRAGARNAAAAAPPLKATPASSPGDAVLRSLPLLQRADVAFLRTAGCVSCHNNSQTAETVALARARGLPVDEAVATGQRQKIAQYLDEWRERVLTGQGIGGEVDTMAVIVNGLAAERHPADFTTDAMARFIRLQQTAGGYWRVTAHRPPIESGDLAITALCMRALQHYAPAHERAIAAEAIRRGAAWLAGATSDETQDRAYQVLGLFWAGAGRPAVAAAAQNLLSGQRKDGGWAQIPALDSDAYATGEALVALLASGAMSPSAPGVRRGIEFLRRTQLADGSWFVARRAIPIQPYFDAGFPHGRDQFISAAATNWATQALILATTRNGS